MAPKLRRRPSDYMAGRDYSDAAERWWAMSPDRSIDFGMSGSSIVDTFDLVSRDGGQGIACLVYHRPWRIADRAYEVDNIHPET